MSKKKKGRDTDYHKKEQCEACNKKPKLKSLLHTDHLDGNSKNNDIKNYWTLCITCHSIKTLIEYRNKQIIELSNRLVDLEQYILDLGEKLPS